MVGTFDTKGAELDTSPGCCGRPGAEVRRSTSARRDAGGADVAAAEVAAHHPDGADAVFTGDRGCGGAGDGEALERFAAGPRRRRRACSALGGSGGTALVAPAMRALPVGVPKMMVSTVASGNVAPYVGAVGHRA